VAFARRRSGVRIPSAPLLKGAQYPDLGCWVAPPSTLGLGKESDSGTKGDGITNDDTPEVNGVAEPGSTVYLCKDDDTAAWQERRASS
jgi:Bacterial Ig-like domain